jgi:hypothetical protein
MLRIVDFPQPEGPTDGLRERDRLLDREGHPHLHAAVIVPLVDREIPVEDRLVVADRLEHHLALERVHVRLPEEIDDLVVLRSADPLLRPVVGVDVALHEVRRLFDGLLEHVADGDGDRTAEHARPRLLVRDVVDRAAEAFLHGGGLPLRHRHDRVELARLETAEHRRGGAAPYPLHVVVHRLAVRRLRVLEHVDAVHVSAGPDGRRGDHRLPAHELLVAERLDGLHAPVEQLFPRHDVGVGAPGVRGEDHQGVLALLRDLERMVRIAEREEHLSGGERLDDLGTAARHHEVGGLQALLLEELLGRGDEMLAVHEGRHAVGGRDRLHALRAGRPEPPGRHDGSEAGAGDGSGDSEELAPRGADGL